MTSPRAAFLAVVHDDTDPLLLGGANADLDPVGQIRTAGTDVRAEDIGAVTFIMHPAGDFTIGMADGLEIPHAVDGEAPNRREKQLEVVAGDQLGEHPAGVLEQTVSQLALTNCQSLGNTRQKPDRLNGRLGDPDITVLGQNVAIRRQSPGRDRLLNLRHIDPGFGDRDGGADVQALFQLVTKDIAHHVTERIQRNNLGRVAPLRVRTDRGGR